MVGFSFSALVVVDSELARSGYRGRRPSQGLVSCGWWAGGTVGCGTGRVGRWEGGSCQWWLIGDWGGWRQTSETLHMTKEEGGFQEASGCG